MSFATVSIPQSLLHLPSNRSARAASGKAFALSGWRGGVVGHDDALRSRNTFTSSGTSISTTVV